LCSALAHGMKPLLAVFLSPRYRANMDAANYRDTENETNDSKNKLSIRF
jgi:hypothetical protein